MILNKDFIKTHITVDKKIVVQPNGEDLLTYEPVP